MEKPALYIETSIAGYLAAEQSRDIITAARQEVTREWWNTRRSRFRLFTSEFTVREAEEGNPEAAEQRARVLDGIEELHLREVGSFPPKRIGESHPQGGSA